MATEASNPFRAMRVKIEQSDGVGEKLSMAKVQDGWNASYEYELRQRSSTQHRHGFSKQFSCQTSNLTRPEAVAEAVMVTSVVSAPCVTETMHYLNECSHQETVICHDKACSEVRNSNTATGRFSITKIALGDFSILNTDGQCKHRLS